MVKEPRGVGDGREVGVVRRSGWLGGWGGQGAHRGEKVERRGKAEKVG